MAKSEEVPEKKAYGLKKVETGIIANYQNLAGQYINMFISYVLSERLGYTITPQTHFDLSNDGRTLTVWEEPEKEKDEPSPKRP